MVYIFGFCGFIMGFAVGLGLINVMLRHHSNKELKENKSLNWTYGLIVWFMAGFGGWIGVWLYKNYFL